jgi:hypothetical protein
MREKNAQRGTAFRRGEGCRRFPREEIERPIDADAAI